MTRSHIARREYNLAGRGEQGAVRDDGLRHLWTGVQRGWRGTSRSDRGRALERDVGEALIGSWPLSKTRPAERRWRRALQSSTKGTFGYGCLKIGSVSTAMRSVEGRRGGTGGEAAYVAWEACLELARLPTARSRTAELTKQARSYAPSASVLPSSPALLIRTAAP